MSSTANTIIKLRKSGVSGNAPSDLVYGELAINYADGKLWYKNGTGVKAIYNQKAFDTINANSTLIIAGYADTLSMVGNNGIIITGDGINKKITIDIDKDQFMGATGATGPVVLLAPQVRLVLRVQSILRCMTLLQQHSIKQMHHSLGLIQPTLKQIPQQ